MGMKLIKILEGITNSGDDIIFDFQSDSQDDIIRLKLQPFNKRFATRNGKEIYIGYKYKVTDKLKLDMFRDALKSNSFSERDENILVNKAVENFIKINKYPIDLIITPKSSGRALNKLAKQINAKYPGSILADGTMLKRTYDEFLIGGQKLSEMPPDRLKKILPQLKRASRSGEFKMKEISTKFRYLITNFLKFSNNQHRNITEKITTGTVLLVDDILTGGSTFKEMFSIIESMGCPQAIGFALIASK
jgi:phosphoribosylpyrophosphate synthetase